MVDVAQMKIAVSTLNERRAERIKLRQEAERTRTLTAAERSLTADDAKYFSSVERAFRRGIEDRGKALKQLAAIAPPFQIILFTPFMVWATPPRILIDSHIESGNNWAKIHSIYDRTGGDGQTTDGVFFYFFWQNDTGADALVNVESELMLNGICGAGVAAAWMPNVGGGDVQVYAQLNPFEWWNQPPTQPLQQPGQEQLVKDLWNPAPCCRWLFVQGRKKTAIISGDYKIYYDTFLIPNNDVAVFEVGLSLTHSIIGTGETWVDFLDDSLILCPLLELDILHSGGGRP
jgi:hypothetical protein